MNRCTIELDGAVSSTSGDSNYAEHRSGGAVPREGGITTAYHGRTVRHRSEHARDNGQRETDRILALRGTGKALWVDENADAYVARLRDRWR